MSDPDPLSPDDNKALGHDKWGFILRIFIVVYLGAGDPRLVDVMIE